MTKRKTNARLIVGIMSGTSVDAIDAALVRVEGNGKSALYRVNVLHHIERKWPDKLRKRLLAAMAPATVTVGEICELNVLTAQQFAATAEQCLKAARLRKEKITAIGSHGQTICHLPNAGATLQIGSPSVIATLTNLPTVGDFRLADMALGGQGAPLVPWTDWVLLSDPHITRCLQNIGGIGNVTFLPAGKKQNSVVAFDTGPGNMAIDAVVALATNGRLRFDRGGKLAQRGTLDVTLLKQLQKHPYFTKRPPKSTGRENFGATWVKTLLTKNQKPEDIICTLTRLTAWSIADAYRRFLPRMPDEVILCGGGADNPVLTKMLAEELGPTIMLRRIDEFGIPNKAKEAASFALLAAATLDGIPANLPNVTGAKRPVILGVIANPF